MENFINDESSNDIFIIIVDFLSYRDILSFYLSNKIIKNKIDKVLQINLKGIKDFAIFFKKIFIPYPIYSSLFSNNASISFQREGSGKKLFRISFKNNHFVIGFYKDDCPYQKYWKDFIQQKNLYSILYVDHSFHLLYPYIKCFLKYQISENKIWTFDLIVKWIKCVSEKFPQKIGWIEFSQFSGSYQHSFLKFGIHSPYELSLHFPNFISKYSFGLKCENEIMKKYFLKNSKNNKTINLNFFQENHYLSKEKYIQLITECFENQKI